MVTKPTGRRAGRPRLPLRDDPERYVLTYFEVVARRNADAPGFSRRGLAAAIVMAWEGELVNEPANVARWLDGSGPVEFRAAKHNARSAASAFQPRADDFARKVRKFATGDCDEGDLALFTTLSLAWATSLYAPPEPAIVREVARLCAEMDETSFFTRVLARFLEARAGGRPLPLFSLPGFIPHTPGFIPHDMH